MRQFFLTTIFAAGCAAAAAAQTPPPTGTSGRDPRDPSEVTARASLKDATGSSVGEARLIETPNGILLQVDLNNAPAGVHGFHIHENGTCTAPTFASAGGHWAPAGQAHGFRVDRGPHAGDLPNIHVPQEGKLAFELFLSDVTLSPGKRSLLDVNGAALVLHAAPDDYESQPSGDAGDRLACGVVMK